MYPYYIQNWYTFMTLLHKKEIYFFSFEIYGPIFKIQLFDRIVVYSIDPNVVKVKF